MNKKIIISLGIIGLAAAIAIGATTAFFSDTETSTGNTFTAGAIDLQVDSVCTYNGVSSNECGTWTLKDLEPTVDKFFNFADVKPGDVGENTISLHVINNDAWVCAEVSNLTDLENGQNEPEAAVDSTSGTNEGELSQAMNWIVWRDDGAGSGGIEGDNIQNGTEQTLASGHPVNGVLPVYDSTTGGGALIGGSTAYLGVAWTLPAETGNEVQTDSMTGDISFNVVQSRNNADFSCIPPQITRIDRTQTGFGDGGWAGWSCPAGTTAVGGGIVSSLYPVGGHGVAAPSAPAVGGFDYPIYPHYTFTTDTGYVVYDLSDGIGGNTISFYVNCQTN